MENIQYNCLKLQLEKLEKEREQEVQLLTLKIDELERKINTLTQYVVVDSTFKL